MPGRNLTSAQDLLEQLLPLVIQTATDSASSTAKVAAALTSMETAIEANTAAINRWADAKKKENELKQLELEQRGRAEENRSKAELGKIAWAKESFTAPVLIQLLVTIGGLLGLWSQFPTVSQDLPPPSEYSVENPAWRTSPGTPVPDP